MSLLVEPESLKTILNDDGVRLLDTRFDLSDPESGRRAYQQGHIPGAVYADLEQDLSGTVDPGRTGRHPLPEPIHLQKKLQTWGIDAAPQVVVYDDGSHAMAARAWWLLRWMGINRVTVLHGGVKAWQKHQYPVTTQLPDVQQSSLLLSAGFMPTVTAEDILKRLDTLEFALVDARSEARFSGAEEPIDPVAGHIPGAVCYPFTSNMNEQGQFLSKSALRKRFEPLLEAGCTPVFYCGSGVTACHNLLAMEYAGLGTGALYPGSWSEWITDSRRPVVSSN